MAPLAVHEPAEMTDADWEQVVEGMDAEDARREAFVRQHEKTETDLGVSLDIAPELRARPQPRKPKPEKPIGDSKPKRRRVRTAPKSPYPTGPMHYSENRWHFPNVIGMSGTWYGPVHFWQNKDGVIFDCRGEPCEGCDGAELTSGTICGRCDRSGKDATLPEVTAAEREMDKTKYIPGKLKGGVV